jgi:hypothetical protein
LLIIDTQYYFDNFRPQTCPRFFIESIFVCWVAIVTVYASQEMHARPVMALPAYRKRTARITKKKHHTLHQFTSPDHSRSSKPTKNRSNISAVIQKAQEPRDHHVLVSIRLQLSSAPRHLSSNRLSDPLQRTPVLHPHRDRPNAARKKEV